MIDYTYACSDYMHTCNYSNVIEQTALKYKHAKTQANMYKANYNLLFTVNSK